MTSSLLYYLSDSAFPSGSFCFSNGVEVLKNIGNIEQLEPFIIDLLMQAASELPFVLVAYDNSEDTKVLMKLSRAFSILNINDSRLKSSLQQGKSYYMAVCKSFFLEEGHYIHTLKVLFDKGLQSFIPCIYGVFSKQIGLSKSDSLQLYLLTFLKNSINAAVRLDLMDAYYSQLFMLNQDKLIKQLVDLYIDFTVDPAFTIEEFLNEALVDQLNPSLDIFQGLHDNLNTKLFIN